MSRPEEDLTYDNLPDEIKSYLFKHHKHDKDGHIIYDEEDVIRLIFKMLNGKSY